MISSPVFAASSVDMVGPSGQLEMMQVLYWGDAAINENKYRVKDDNKLE